MGPLWGHSEVFSFYGWGVELAGGGAERLKAQKNWYGWVGWC